LYRYVLTLFLLVASAIYWRQYPDYCRADDDVTRLIDGVSVAQLGCALSY